MPFVKLTYHLVWAFKNREPNLTLELENQLFPFLVAKAHSLGCQILALNGYEDHIHIVISAPPTLSVSAMVKSLKGASAVALSIHWQVGFGAFTVGEKGLPIAIAYVANQKRHHAQNTTFRALERWADEEPNSVREEEKTYRVDHANSGDGPLT